MEEEKKVTYKGYGDIILNQEDDINYYNASQDFELAQGLLLGYYDEKGDYTISEDICKELVGLDKLIDETASNKYYVSAKVGDYKLKFEIDVEKKDTKKVAYLYFKESFSLSGVLEKNFSTLVASYIDNLFARIEAEGKDMSNLDKAAKILATKKGLLDKRSKLYYQRDNIDKAYVKEILNILKNSGPGGKRLILMYLEAVRSKNLNKLKVNKYVTLRQVLDLYMQNAMVEGYFPDKNMRQIRDARKKQMEKINSSQAEYSANTAKKGGGKSKGGGGAKKAKGKSAGGGGKGKPAAKKGPAPFVSAPLPSDVFSNSSKPEIAPKQEEPSKKLFNSLPPIVGLKQSEKEPNVEERVL